MKIRESGMPDETYWESLFDIPVALELLQLDYRTRSVAELGCGYGTFTIPIARRSSGVVFAFDIEEEMVRRTRARAKAASAFNVSTARRDVVRDGFGLEAGSCDAVLLFNILHAVEPAVLLREAVRVLRPGGRALVMHWRSDVPTPRGPPLDIRPRPEQVHAWSKDASLEVLETVTLPPWHFGVILGS